MKCPKCGQEIRDGKACPKCGSVPESLQRMEVEYKDFKVSELLDIKVRKKVPAGKEIPKIKAEDKRPKGKASAAKKRSWTKATATLFIFVIALIFFFLVRVFLKF